MRKIVIVGFIFFLSGCSHTVLSKTSPAVNIHSSYEGKMKGPVALVIDYDPKAVHQEVKPSSHICSGYSYSIRVGEDLSSSIQATTNAIFEQVVEQPALPTKGEMKEKEIQGTIYVRLNRFDPGISFSRGVWQTDAMASCDIVLDIVVTDSRDKELLVTTVAGARRVESGGVGTFCRGGGNILSNAISQGIRETMERYAERVSNSEEIREAFGEKERTEIESKNLLLTFRKHYD
jgi:hypothetical protein